MQQSIGPDGKRTDKRREMWFRRAGLWGSTPIHWKGVAVIAIAVAMALGGGFAAIAIGHPRLLAIPLIGGLVWAFVIAELHMDRRPSYSSIRPDERPGAILGHLPKEDPLQRRKMPQAQVVSAEPDRNAATRSAYAEIDGVIERWVERDNLNLYREWKGEVRFWYTTRGEECFQVSIDPPTNGSVIVHASSIETDDDAELIGEWSVDLAGLERALLAATKLIDLWAARARISA